MMKKFLSFKLVAIAASVVSMAVLFTSCKKNKDVVQTPVAGLMAFNLSTDQPMVSVALSGNLIGGAPLSYGSFTGNYLNIYTGNRQVSSYGASNTLLDSLTYPFEQGKYYSVFVVGTNNNYRNVVVQDNYDSLTASSGKAYVRFVNAVTGLPSSNVTINSGETNVVNSTSSFGQVSPFMAVAPGSLSIAVSGSAVNASRTITVDQQKAYTVLLMGQSNSTDSTRAVQIRFIENGTVTD